MPKRNTVADRCTCFHMSAIVALAKEVIRKCLQRSATLQHPATLPHPPNDDLDPVNNGE